MFRKDGVDTVACHDEVLEGEPLLGRVWTGDAAEPQPTLDETRAHAKASISALPESARTARTVEVPVSPGIEALVRRLVEEGK